MQVLPALLLVTAAFVPTAASAQGGERYTLSGDEVAVYNIAGALSVEPGTGPVSVALTRGGTDAAKLKVEQGDLDDRETLRVIYPVPIHRLCRHRAGIFHHVAGSRGRDLRGPALASGWGRLGR